jgi:hypothetical protein
MVHSGKHIIESVLKKHPQPEPIEILNQSDENLEASIQITKQYIVGIVQQDHAGGIDRYRSWFQKTLDKYIHPNFIDCLPFHFEPDDLEEMKSALEEVAAYFKVKIDATAMLKSIPTAKYILVARLSFTMVWQKFFYSVYRMLRYDL